MAISEAVGRRVFLEFCGFEGGLAYIVLGDGALHHSGHLRLCPNELKTHLLVNSKELGTLLILKDAEAIFRAPGALDRRVEEIGPRSAVLVGPSESFWIGD